MNPHLVHDIQDRLPQWGAVHGDRVILGRARHARSSPGGLAFIAQHLLTINWADSGPGFSWPEAYHLVYVPGFERHVVVASQDSPDVWGCTDHALGHFSARKDRLEGARRIICRDWHRQFKEYEQTPWAYLFDEGLITAEVAEGWRRRIWARSQFRDW